MAFQFLVQATEETAVLNTTLLKFFMPIFLFMFVFALMYALLKKTKLLGDAPFPIMIMSFVVAIIFVVTPATFKFTNVITPWLVVFIISLLFIFLILSWLEVYKFGEGGGMAGAVGSTWLAWLIFIVIIAIFIFAGIATFGPLLSPFSDTGDTAAGAIGSGIKNVLFHPAVLGLALLFVIAAITSWVIGTKEG